MEGGGLRDRQKPKKDGQTTLQETFYQTEFVYTAQAAEKAFFDIYQKFCDIGDPVPTLEFCIDAMKVRFLSFVCRCLCV